MRFDAQLVKEQVSLAEIFRGDGHILKKAGPNYFKCRCPFHTEKTASCVVHDRPENYFKCFGCDEGGSVFDYWMKTRGCDFNAAITQLGAGPAISEKASTRPVSEPTDSPAPQLAPPMDEVVANAWAEAVQRLKEHPERMESIAQWRGYSIETVRWANERGLLGMLPFMGVWREAFLVERPDVDSVNGNPGTPLADDLVKDAANRRTAAVPVGYHVRLAPKTAGNPGDKASWRYVPTGIGNWPFVIGNVTRARVLFFLEGQWDGLALLDCHDSGQVHPLIKVPPSEWKIAIVGMRGATSWKRFMDCYTWNSEATAFVLGDADTAGAKWCEEGGFIEQLRLRCNRVWTLFPKRGKDFNNLWKERLITRDKLVMILRDKMRHKISGRRNPGVTFLQFCRKVKGREDTIGEAASIIVGDKRHRPAGRKPLKVWERYFHKYVPEQNRSAMYAAWREWQRDVASDLKKVAA